MTKIVYAHDKLAISLLLFKAKLQRGKVIGIDVAPGELQFFRSVLMDLLERRADFSFFLFYRYAGPVIKPIMIRGFDHRLTHIEHVKESFDLFTDLAIYITTEQFIPGPPTVFTVTMFHGQPSKGLTFKYFEHDPLASNDGLFLYGPLQRQALDEHLEITGSTIPNHLSLFEIGYTKSDRLIRGDFNRLEILSDLGLDPAKRTIIYAPAFNEGASMREQGVEIVSTLAALTDFNVIAKLAIDCLLPELVGGENWFEIIGSLESQYKNFKMLRELEAERGLAVADVLITCISSIGYEFLALKKPVVFIDAPRYFTDVLPKFFPEYDVSTWSSRTVVNGGKEFGVTVDSPAKLAVAINEVLANPHLYPKNQDQLPQRLLYNPGQATAAAVDRILKIVDGGTRSKRAVASVSRPRAILHWLKAGQSRNP